jgi:hypothetical protein
MLSLSPGPKAKKNCQNLKLRGYFRVPTNFLKTEVGGEGGREKNSAMGWVLICLL